MAVGGTRMMVPASKKKLEKFLKDQVAEMKDFVSETDESRFMDRVEDIDSSSSSDVEMEEISDIQVNSDISGISEMSEEDMTE